MSSCYCSEVGIWFQLLLPPPPPVFAHTKAAGFFFHFTMDGCGSAALGAHLCREHVARVSEIRKRRGDVRKQRRHHRALRTAPLPRRRPLLNVAVGWLVGWPGGSLLHRKVRSLFTRRMRRAVWRGMRTGWFGTLSKNGIRIRPDSPVSWTWRIRSIGQPRLVGERERRRGTVGSRRGSGVIAHV